MNTVKACVYEPTSFEVGQIRFLYFGVIFWQFRLSRFLISIKETRLLTTRKIKKLDFGLYKCIQHLFTTLPCNPPLCKVHEANYSTLCKPVSVVGILVSSTFFCNYRLVEYFLVISIYNLKAKLLV